MRKHRTLLVCLLLLMYALTISSVQASPPPWKRTDNTTPSSPSEIYTEFAKFSTEFDNTIEEHNRTVNVLKRGLLPYPPWKTQNYLQVPQGTAESLLNRLQALKVSGVYADDRQKFIDACTLLQTALKDLQTYINSKNQDADAYARAQQAAHDAAQLKAEAWKAIQEHVKADGYLPPN